jgi:hypothetical protein
VERAIAGPIPLARIAVQPRQQRRKLIEVFQPRDVGLLDFLSAFRHARQYDEISRG